MCGLKMRTNIVGGLANDGDYNNNNGMNVGLLSICFGEGFWIKKFRSSLGGNEKL